MNSQWQSMYNVMYTSWTWGQLTHSNTVYWPWPSIVAWIRLKIDTQRSDEAAAVARFCWDSPPLWCQSRSRSVFNTRAQAPPPPPAARRRAAHRIWSTHYRMRGIQIITMNVDSDPGAVIMLAPLFSSPCLQLPYCHCLAPGWPCGHYDVTVWCDVGGAEVIWQWFDMLKKIP